MNGYDLHKYLQSNPAAPVVVSQQVCEVAGGSCYIHHIPSLVAVSGIQIATRI